MILNYLYKKTNHYNNKFADIERLKNLPPNLDIVNLGSNQPKFAFDYSSIREVRGMNWAVGPESLEYDFAILRNCSYALHKNSAVLIPICPLNFFLYRHAGVDEHIRYYGFLPDKEIANFSCGFVKSEIKYPLYYHPKRIRFLLKDVAPVSSLLQKDSNPMDETLLEKDADRWIEGWNREFDIDINHIQLSELNKQCIQKNIDILKSMLAFCLKNNFQAVLMTLPVTRHLGGRFSDKFVEEHILNYINMANKEYGVLFLHYLGDKRFTDTAYYFNSFFMNKTGRKLFTEEVISELKRKGRL